jgi:hypothetical protein
MGKNKPEIGLREFLQAAIEDRLDLNNHIGSHMKHCALAQVDDEASGKRKLTKN